MKNKCSTHNNISIIKKRHEAVVKTKVIKSSQHAVISLPLCASSFFSLLTSLLPVLSRPWNLYPIFICTCIHINTSIKEKPHVTFSWRCLMSTAAPPPCTKAFISNECNTAVDPDLLPLPHVFILSFVPHLHSTNSHFLQLYMKIMRIIRLTFFPWSTCSVIFLFMF